MFADYGFFHVIIIHRFYAHMVLCSDIISENQTFLIFLVCVCTYVTGICEAKVYVLAYL